MEYVVKVIWGRRQQKRVYMPLLLQQAPRRIASGHIKTTLGTVISRDQKNMENMLCIEMGERWQGFSIDLILQGGQKPNELNKITLNKKFSGQKPSCSWRYERASSNYERATTTEQDDADHSIRHRQSDDSTLYSSR